MCSVIGIDWKNSNRVEGVILSKLTLTGEVRECHTREIIETEN